MNKTNRRPDSGLSLQEMILRLNKYWAAQGCVLWLPSNTEVGAGTMNPATFLRVLGPESWHVAYLEPSVRPDDSRYGENPNRVQQHLQYQVILKPDPGTPQELYLGSLESLGIDRSKHDVRFVEDNWESPALGAWGLGWEVWLDGTEISQFTYFQQAGGIPLDPVTVEITYGLERIAMTLQRVRHFKHIRYSPGLTYGELLGQNEYEMSVYNLDAADPSRLGQMFSLYEQEAKMLLGAGLVLPGYSYVLKCSQVFNLLDARGAIGVTERAAYFARMRDLAHDAARLWLAKREEQGFPLKITGGLSEMEASADDQSINAGTHVAAPRTFVLEIGTEELPAADVDSALQQLRDRVAPWFAERRLAHGDVTVEGTPRRLAVIVRDLQPRQSDEMRIAKGPAERIALDDAGRPTNAALGFARSQGVEIGALRVEDIEGGRYVVARQSVRGRPTADVLCEDLPGLIASLQFASSMRWNPSNVAFSRPLRWLVALLGEHVVPFKYAGVRAGRRSRGLRSDGSPEFDVPSAESYSQLVTARGVVLDRVSRASAIRERGKSLATTVRGSLAEDGSLLAEVTNLVEAPTVLLGEYDSQYLSLPREVLVTVMRKHQRYFPVASANNPGQLLPHFVAVANGNIDESVVRQGNEDVLAARYADASFFWEHDRSQSLEAWRSRLAGLTFQSKLGSMLDKSNRIEMITPRIAALLGVSDDELGLATRIAHLAKADLVTHMVIEFTNLQGVMGREYATHSGEPPSVAQGIFEHYLPRFSGDVLPESLAAITVGISDRLDSLVGLFAVGLAPRATSDPFASRRAALGLVQILAERQLDLDIRRALAEVAAVQPVEVIAQVQEEVLVFIRRRLEQWLLERGSRADVVKGVLAQRGDNPALAFGSVQELDRLADTDRFQRALKAYARAARLLRGKSVQPEVVPELFESDSERRLWAAVCQVARSVNATSSVSEFLDAFEPLVGLIDAFFDSVLVMAKQENIRTNRHALLRCVSDLPQGIVDLSQIRGF